MRLSDQQKDIIVKVLKKHFGDASTILIFGSRIADLYRGKGDRNSLMNGHAFYGIADVCKTYSLG